MDQRHSNFEFLDLLDRELANLGRLAESYFQDDPSTSLIKLRQFGERLTRRHAALVGSDVQDGETQADVLRRLQYERSAPDRVLDVLHHIRKLGNAAVHDGAGNHREALACLKMAVQLGFWHVRTSTAEKDFAARPFLPPSSPQNPNIELQQELERLRVERNEALSAAQKAEESHREARLAAESAEARHQREQEERKTWEALAKDADRQLRDFVEQAQRQAPAAKMSFVTAANEAAGVIDLDEQATRALIDQQLRDRGWEAHSADLRYGMVLAIFTDAITHLREPKDLKTLTTNIDKIDWFTAREDGLGDMYEGLMQKVMSDTKSKAGQYFTPRALIDSIIRLIKPAPGEVIQDPATGTGGFLIAADRYIKDATDDLFNLSEADGRFQRRQPSSPTSEKPVPLRPKCDEDESE